MNKHKKERMVNMFSNRDKAKKRGFEINMSFSDFNHAVKVLEVMYEMKGEQWEEVKATNSMDALINFLDDEEGMAISTFQYFE